MTNFSDGGIPKRKFTLQYQPLSEILDEGDKDTPSVADGKEITLFVETVEEIFQKEPTYIPIQRTGSGHYQGDKTQVVDSLKCKHKFNITAFVYAGKQGRQSLPDDILEPGNKDKANVTDDFLKVKEFDKFIPLGDTGILVGSETVRNTTKGEDLVKGTDYDIDYAKGQIRFRRETLDDPNQTDSFNISQETTEILGKTISSTTVISDDIKINYSFRNDANNVGKLIRRMSQLGNPLVMRMDEKDLSKLTDNEDNRAQGFLVVPNKVTIKGKSEKPDETKIELELRKGTPDV